MDWLITDCRTYVRARTVTYNTRGDTCETSVKDTIGSVSNSKFELGHGSHSEQMDCFVYLDSFWLVDWILYANPQRPKPKC